MHSDITESLGDLNRAISHVSDMASRHGDHHRLEPYIDAVEMAAQRLEEEAKEEPADTDLDGCLYWTKLPPETAEKVADACERTGLQPEEVIRLTVCQAIEAVRGSFPGPENWQGGDHA